MTLVDTSAWVHYLRASSDPVRSRVRELIRRREMATTDVVVMEVLAGARSQGELRDLARLLGLGKRVPVAGLETWEEAAAIFRECRRYGFTPRSQLDCLIAAVALRQDVPVLHADRDFDLIAAHTPLRVVAVN